MLGDNIAEIFHDADVSDADRSRSGSRLHIMAYLSKPPGTSVSRRMESLLEKPLGLFFPVGAVRVRGDGAIEPVLDPDCPHAFSCPMKCYSVRGWEGFVRKMRCMLEPTPGNWRLSVRSYSLPGAELAAVWCDTKGRMFSENKYKFM